jgi:choline dehydrogenase-like flavoprotein
MTTTGATLSIQLDLDKDGEIDTKINLLHFTENGRHGSSGDYFHSEPGFSLSITPLFPKSRGSIRAVGDEAYIDPNYLEDSKDVEVLKLALVWCLNFLDSDEIKPHVSSVIDRVTMESSPNDYICTNLYSGHHLVGGAHTLVDENFQCKDIPRLYICDASVMSEHLSSNIHAPVVLLADAFARRSLTMWS